MSEVNPAAEKQRLTMNKIKAFFQGVQDFRSAFTTHYEDQALLEAHDCGRELAHRITLRHFDH